MHGKRRYCPLCDDYMPDQVCSVHGVATVGESASFVLDESLLTGTLIGDRYRVQHILGEGGMGRVYLAWQNNVRRWVALKTLRLELVEDDELWARFYREARAAAALNHPNIVRLFDFGIDESVGPFMVMEYLEGQSLQQVLAEKGPLNEDALVQVASSVARALTDAHGQQTVHRDLKPANIFLRKLSDGSIQTKVLDFGIAQVKAGGENRRRPLTGESVTLGTAEYMSPEQARNDTLDFRTDLYALGCVIYTMATGKAPFRAKSPLDVLMKQVKASAPSLPARLVDDVPPSVGLVSLYDDLMAKKPEDRPGSTHEVVERLETLRSSPKLLFRRDEDNLEPRMNVEVGQPTVLSIAPTQDNPTFHAAPFATNLPNRADVFVGRETAMIELSSRINDGQRFISVRGAGGMGKTRLCQEFGAKYLQEFSGGVWFVDLTECTSRNEVFNAVGRALEVPLTNDEPADQLGMALVQRGEALVILDNCEQVVLHLADVVLPWLHRAPEVVFLATTRTPVGIEGEHLYDLPPLPLERAIELFEVRGSAACNGFKVMATNRADIVEIVTRLDCVALAIELAAARIRLLPPAQLAQRLDQRFMLLRGRRGGRAQRQATLQGAIDWSWDLLKPWEKAGLAQCSIFVGGFHLAAAEAVLDLEHWDAWTLDVVQGLIDQSLLRREENDAGQVRFVMFESIREYARARLREESEEGVDGDFKFLGADAFERCRRAHLAYFTGLGNAYVSIEDGTLASVSAVDDLEADVENVVAALLTALDIKDVESAGACAMGASRVYHRRGPILSALGMLERLEQTFELKGELLFRVLHEKGVHLGDAGRRDASVASFQAALEISESNGGKAQQALTYARLGQACLDQSQIELAEAHAKRALKLAETVGHVGHQMLALHGLARVNFMRGDIQQAEAGSERVLQLAERLPHHPVLVAALRHLGVIYENLGRKKDALKLLERSLRISREGIQRKQEAATLGQIANLYRRLNNLDRAREFYELALSIQREIGNLPSAAVVQGNLGELLLDEGDSAAAEPHLIKAIEIGDQAWPIASAAFRGTLSYLRAQDGDFSTARELLKRGAEVLRQAYPMEYGKLLCRWAHVELMDENPAEAQKRLEMAVVVAEELGFDRDSALSIEIEKLRQRL